MIWCNIKQSQLAHLATRTSQPRDQDVGLLPPVTTFGHSRGHQFNNDPCSGGAEPENQHAPRRLVQQVRFEFYSKPSASSTFIMASSAQPWGQKRTTLTQELIRRLLNCSKELSCEVRRRHLNNYMQLLKNSGYCEKFRAEVLRSGLLGYSKIVAAEKRGGGQSTDLKIGKNLPAGWPRKRKRRAGWDSSGNLAPSSHQHQDPN